MRRKTEMPLPNVRIKGTNYNAKGKLSGRGQAGLAGFYSRDNENKQFLIKQDNPGTCLAEGLAVSYLPPGTKDRKAVNRATMQEASVGDQNMLVSIQDRVVPEDKPTSQDKPEPKPVLSFASFDTLILGHKRNPKTIVSEEARNKDQIKNYMATEMSEDAKLQLAQAIYISQVNGDESLHTGQFVCFTEKVSQNGVEKEVIRDIKRIDFGALGRYGALRGDFDPTQTSDQYAKSGQIGKNYVGYLMQDPVVSNEVHRLWSVTDPNEVAIQVGAQFDAQMNNVSDPELKKEALREFNNSLTGTKSEEYVEEGQVKNNLINSTLSRCEGMKQCASEQLPVIAFENYIAQESAKNPNDSVFKQLVQYSKEISDLPPSERFDKLNDKQMELRAEEANNQAKSSIDAIRQYVEQNKNTQDPLVSNLQNQLKTGDKLPAALQLKALEGIIARDAQEIAASRSASVTQEPVANKPEESVQAAPELKEAENEFQFQVGGIPPDTSPLSSADLNFDFESNASAPDSSKTDEAASEQIDYNLR